MSKKVEMSVGKYIFFSSMMVLVGAGVVGLPAVMQSKVLYEENENLHSKVSSLESTLREAKNSALWVDSRVNALESELNRVKRNANNLLYNVTMSQGGKVPSGWEYETCEYGLEAVHQCR